jgi:hypothetical protein
VALAEYALTMSSGDDLVEALHFDVEKLSDGLNSRKVCQRCQGDACSGLSEPTNATTHVHVVVGGFWSLHEHNSSEAGNIEAAAHMSGNHTAVGQSSNYSSRSHRHAHSLAHTRTLSHSPSSGFCHEQHLKTPTENSINRLRKTVVIHEMLGLLLSVSTRTHCQCSDAA